MTKLVFIVVPNYRDPELMETKTALGTDIHLEIASNTLEMLHGAEGSTVVPNLFIENVVPADYDGIVIIGGPGMYDTLYNDADTTEKIVEQVKAFNAAGKLVAAICISPIALAKAGIISGKNVTCYDSDGKQKAELEAAGAKFTGENVTRDGNIITGNGPTAASAFGAEIKKYFETEGAEHSESGKSVEEIGETNEEVKTESSEGIEESETSKEEKSD